MFGNERVNSKPTKSSRKNESIRIALGKKETSRSVFIWQNDLPIIVTNMFKLFDYIKIIH